MVSEVAFHTGVADKLAYACRLLRKAYRSGARVAVTGDAPILQRLDQALWVFEPQEFVPHLLVRAREALRDVQARTTPIFLVEPGAQVPSVPVLVNLGPERWPGDAHFDRIIEIVSADAEDAAVGRRRWKAYEAQGWAITHHPQGTRG